MGDWIPLMDYAMKTGVSLSTLRRYIKANKIQYRVENGRYLLQLNPQAVMIPATQKPIAAASRPAAGASFSPAIPPSASSNPGDAQQEKIRRLATELKRAQEEIAELKTLIAFYEETLGRANSNRFNV